MSVSPLTAPDAERLPAPKAKKVPVIHTAHGHERLDNYAWMRADNWQEVMRDPATLDPEIRAHLDAENAYCEAVMGDWGGLIGELHKEMIGRIKDDDEAPPSARGPYEYLSRFEKGGQHRRYLRRPRGGGPEELLFDANAVSKDFDFYNLGGFGVSPDHKLLAVAEDTQGDEAYRLRIKDLETGNWLEDSLYPISGNFTWIETSGGLLYTTLDDSHRASKVWRHLLGQDGAKDALVYEETDGAWQVSLAKTNSRRFHMISRGTSGSNAVFLMDAGDEAAEPRLVAEALPDVYYSMEDQGDRFFILTNRDGATNFKICTAPLDDPRADNWQTWLAASETCLVEHMELFDGYLVRDETERALPRIVVHDLASGEEHTIEQDEEAYCLTHFGASEFDTRVTRFSYHSPTTPTRIYDYDMATRERSLVYQQEVPSGHDPARYKVDRFFTKAKDGAEIPVTVLRLADQALDGSAPLFVYGYGSYGMSQSAGFSVTRLSLVDRGVIYAVAHTRGGMDMGYQWYLDGKLENKVNTFTDFIEVSEDLCARGYGREGEIAAMGGSAGGLLMGAVTNMRPDLYKAIVASVPFVDVLTTILDADLPLTPGEWTEWGNPIEDESVYQRMLAYSPLDNVTAQAYPHMFVTAGLSDPRVTYWEPAKWVAKLRELKTNESCLIFKINTTAGHFGVSGRYDRLIEVAEEYAFVLRAFGCA